MNRRFALVAVLICSLASAQSPDARPHRWPGSIIGRTQSLAALQSLEIDLLTRDSATLVLADWCARHHMDEEERGIVADRDHATVKTPTAAQRRLLGVTPGEPVRYRRVRLRCGTHILSEADNWYVPSRLTPQMNAALDGGTTPFGKVVQPLHFRRHTLSARLLWSPLPAGWDSGTPIPASAAALEIPEHVIENHALLLTGEGVPFSEVVETYTSAVFDFPPPALPAAK